MYTYIVLIIVAIIAINLYPKLFNIDFYDDTTTPLQQQPPPLVGGNPCTWGPSYWCASTANAEKCGLNYDVDCPKYNMTQAPQG